jgi:hypothetical protein
VSNVPAATNCESPACTTVQRDLPGEASTRPAVDPVDEDRDLGPDVTAGDLVALIELWDSTLSSCCLTLDEELVGYVALDELNVPTDERVISIADLADELGDTYVHLYELGAPLGLVAAAELERVAAKWNRDLVPEDFCD